MVSHPFVIPGLVPDDANTADRADASGKLRVLEQLLQKLKAADRRVLLLSQDPLVRTLQSSYALTFPSHLSRGTSDRRALKSWRAMFAQQDCLVKSCQETEKR